MTDIRAAKRELRARMRKARLGLSRKELETRSSRVCDAVVNSDEFVSAGTIALYKAMEGEVDVDRIFEAALSAAKTALFPRVESGKKDLVFCATPSLGKMTPGVWGILEPPVSAKVCPIAEADLVITPGVAFDRKGGRLGQGGGFYDRVFKRLRPRTAKMGVAFDLQLVEEAPMEPDDERIDCLACESGLFRFNRLGGEH